MPLPDAVRNVLSNYATFNGRARRSEFWFWALAVFIAAIVVSIVDAVIGTSILYYLFILAIIVPNLAVGARRLHDTGKSGWFQLLGLIPLVGAIILIVFYCGDSQPDNKYGPNPKGLGGYAPPAPGIYGA